MPQGRPPGARAPADAPPRVDLTGRRIGVTGATGFVGRALVRVLQERGAHVVGVVRNPDRVPQLRADGVELRRADLTDRDSLRSALEGLHALFANAALVSYGQHSKQVLIDTNVRGTENVLHAAADVGVRRVVMTSSASAYRPRSDCSYREDDPLRDRDDRVSRIDYYAVSKGCAERRAWQLARERDLSLTTFRPHQIHGPFDDSSFMLWMRRLMRVPVSLFPTHVYMPSIYVGDLAEVMVRALERPVSEGRAYNAAAEPGTVTYWRLLQAYRKAGGRTARWVLPVPIPIERRYDVSLAKRDLDFENRPLVDGFRQTLLLEQQARERGPRPGQALTTAPSGDSPIRSHEDAIPPTL